MYPNSILFQASNNPIPPIQQVKLQGFFSTMEVLKQNKHFVIEYTEMVIFK